VNGSLQTLATRAHAPATNTYWDAQDVLQKVDSRMTAAFTAVRERAEREQVSLRDAAYLMAIERVAHACRERGWV
jgi:glutamate dehydrogenase